MLRADSWLCEDYGAKEYHNDYLRVLSQLFKASYHLHCSIIAFILKRQGPFDSMVFTRLREATGVVATLLANLKSQILFPSNLMLNYHILNFKKQGKDENEY